MKAKQESIRDLAKGKGRIDNWKVDPRVIKMKPDWNGRDDTPELLEHIESIARSIFFKGYDTTKPIVVWKDEHGYTVSDGHCRLRATLRAIEMGATIIAIPVVCEPQASNEADRVLGMLTRNSGLNLTPLEQGKVYKRLLGFGWDEARIVGETGKPKSYVQSIFALMEASPATHIQVINGKVSPSVVAKAVREHGPSKAERLVTKAVTQASVNGKSKATARDVQAASEGEPATRMRRPSEVVDFFETTLREKDGPPGVIRMAEMIGEFRDGKIGPEKLAKRLAELLAPEMALA